jgi:hypothetical protein
MKRSSLVLQAAAAAVVLGMGTSAMAVNFPELEPNDTKAAANIVPGIVAGDTITGNSTGTSTTVPGAASADYYDLRVGALPAGIYRHRLVLTSNTLGQTGTLRGLGQVAAPADTSPGIPWDGVVGAANATDTTVQTSSTVTTPPRYNQWYGFGKQERLYYRVTGAATTTADYVATMETVPVVPVPIGAYVPGLITINSAGQGHSSDTDLWVYDSNFNAIAGYGNDDESTLAGSPAGGTTLQSWLPRNYAPGTYYIAMSTFQTSPNTPSPSDDDFRTGTLMDFPDSINNSSTTTNVNLTFTIADSGGTSLQVPNTKVGAFDINWFVFTVVPEPTSIAMLGLAVPMLLRRRK